jgi:hypothetical protein
LPFLSKNGIPLVEHTFAVQEIRNQLGQHQMKKQTNPNIKAHLIRGAFYLLLLLAVCAIPFALAQRHSTKASKQSRAQSVFQKPDSAANLPEAAPPAPNISSTDLSQIPKFPYSSYRAPGPGQGVPASQFQRPTLSSGPGGTCNPIQNGGFETGDLTSWVIDGHNNDPVASDTQAHSGTFSGLAGLNPQAGTYCAEQNNEPLGDSSFYQQFTVPAGTSTLSFWYWTCTFDSITFDWQDAYITDTSGNILQTIFHQCTDQEFWTQQTVDMTPYAEQTVRIKFLVHQDGFNPPGDVTGMYVDDVEVVCGGASPTPTPTATGTPVPGCGLLVGSGLTLGYPPNNFTLIASNTVNYTFANSPSAPNEFAVFQTHDPWGGTILTDAITANGHTFSTFTPAQLTGFPFSDYHVIVLDWDDTFTSDFLADYTAAIPALEAYVNAGGVVWVQASIQGVPGDNFPFPFGGQGNAADFSGSDNIVDPSSPMMTGVPNPIVGNFASHVSESDLPGDAHIVVINPNDNQPVIYDLRRGTNCGGTPTPTPSPTATATATATATPTPTGTPGACVRGQGYWKNHPDQWPVTELQLGNVTYDQQQLLDILHQPVRGNGLVSLAHHLIAAKLNIAAGADPSCIEETIAEADALIGDLVVPPVGDGYLAPRDVEAIKDILEDYNEGRLCAPSCDQSPEPTATPMARRGRPNPAPRPR